MVIMRSLQICIRLFLFLSLGPLLCLLQGAQAGLQGFRSWLKKAYPESVHDVPLGVSDVFDVVCVDMNQVLHVAVRNSKTEEKAIKSVLMQLNRYYKICKPRKAVVLAFDGSAPLAKMLSQRRRRISETAKQHDRDGLSRLLLSPGTDFMKKASEAVQLDAAWRIVSYPQFKNVRFFISGADIPGEGELKIFDWINTSPLVDVKSSVVIVGGDADLVLQGLALSKVTKLYMFYRDGLKDGKIINICRIVEAMENRYPGQSDRIRTDFIFLLVCCGNDYLPRVRGINFTKCMEAYSAVKDKWTKRRGEKDAFVVDGSKKTFNFEFLYEFFAHLMASSYVPEICRHPSSSGRPYSAIQSLNQAIVQKTIPMATVHWFDTMQVKGKDPYGQLWQTNLRVGDHVFTGAPQPRLKTVKQELAAAALQSLAPEIYFKLVEKEKLWKEQLEALDIKKDKEEEEIVEGGDEKSSKVVNNKALCSVEGYLRGLLWNIQMYEDGYVPDWFYAYEGKYGPGGRDIVNWLSGKNIIDRLRGPVSHSPPLHSFVACLAVMSLQGIDFVHPKLRGLMREDSPTHYIFTEPEKFNLQELLRAVEEHEEWEEPVFNPERSWIVVQHESSESMNSISKAKGFHIPRIPYLYQGSVSNNEHVMLGWMKATSKPPCHPWSRPSPVSATGKKKNDTRLTPMPFTRKKQWQEMKRLRHRTSSPYSNVSSGQSSPPLVVPPIPLNRRMQPPSRKVTHGSAKGVTFRYALTPTSQLYIHHRIK